MKTADAARGKWKGILLELGVEERFLGGKHGPCPICGGSDRFRFDNKGGNGGYICNQCGGGDGFKLLMGINGWNFHRTAQEVDRVVGNVTGIDAPPKQGMDPAKRSSLLNRVWRDGTKLTETDRGFAYLASRSKLPATLPDLRYTPSCRAPDETFHPALLALVRNPEGDPVNIHRTFLGPNGKADMDNPRAVMPGELPPGSAIRLFQVYGDRLGIAEGIETAFAAAARFNVPVWSAVNSSMLAKWIAPPTVKQILVFGDCDPKFGGQAAAYTLAHRLATRDRLDVQVHIPDAVGLDWADREATEGGR